jgi:hypothetical protein
MGDFVCVGTYSGDADPGIVGGVYRFRGARIGKIRLPQQPNPRSRGLEMDSAQMKVGFNQTAGKRFLRVSLESSNRSGLDRFRIPVDPFSDLTDSSVVGSAADHQAEPWDLQAEPWNLQAEPRNLQAEPRNLQAEPRNHRRP